MSEEQQPLHALPQGHRLQEYELVRVLGFGGFGMTYLGFDHNLDKAVAIKEYLPSDIATPHCRPQRRPTSQRLSRRFPVGSGSFLGRSTYLSSFRPSPHH